MSSDWTESCCPAERIIICVDCCEEPYVNRYPVVEGGKQFSTFGIIKKCTEVFLLNKSALNPKHQFSLLILRATTQRLTSFSSNIKPLLKTLSNLSTESAPEHSMPLSRVFKCVLDAEMKTLEMEEAEDTRPLRLIILFGRQGSCYRDEDVPSSNSDLLVDVIYLHKPLLSAKEKKRTETNLNELQSCLSQHSMCLIALASTYNAFTYMAHLLIHPQLRN